MRQMRQWTEKGKEKGGGLRFKIWMVKVKEEATAHHQAKSKRGTTAEEGMILLVN